VSAIVSNPGQYSFYPSSMVSDWYIWFCELGYPNLDINRYPDGEWEIIEYYNAPIVPSLTKWNRVLYGIRNVVITPGIVEKYVKQLDLHSDEIWDKYDHKTEELEAEQKALERHQKETVDRAYEAIRFNPALMERMARGGITEMNIPNIRKHIPKSLL